MLCSSFLTSLASLVPNSFVPSIPPNGKSIFGWAEAPAVSKQSTDAAASALAFTTGLVIMGS
jgi:hypothetical protein